MFEKLAEYEQRTGSYIRCFGRARGSAFAAYAAVPGRRGQLRKTRALPDEAPVLLRLGTSDIDTFIEVMVNGEYDVALPDPPRTIIDAGANIGLSSVWFARKYPDARIIALEPDPGNFELLVHNTRSLPKVTALREALWSKPGTLSIVDPGLGPWAYRVTASDHECPVAGGQTPATTVDALLERFEIDQIDLLKVDVEGAEKEIFTDVAPWIDNVRSIVIELHDRLTVGCARTFFRAVEAFSVETQANGTFFVSR